MGEAAGLCDMCGHHPPGKGPAPSDGRRHGHAASCVQRQPATAPRPPGRARAPRQPYARVRALDHGGPMAKGPADAEGEGHAVVPGSRQDGGHVLAADLAAALVERDHAVARAYVAQHLTHREESRGGQGHAALIGAANRQTGGRTAREDHGDAASRQRTSLSLPTFAASAALATSTSLARRGLGFTATTSAGA
jgi:hypothetical protein